MGSDRWCGLNINYGILVVDSRKDKDETNPILHFCGFEEPPTEDDYDSLRHELSTNDEFGLVQMMDYIVLVEASSEIVVVYGDMLRK